VTFFGIDQLYDHCRVGVHPKRAAAIMSLIRSARLNRHDPYVYLKDVLTHLPRQRANEIEELPPHKWSESQSCA
jgi:hypothetical protein